MKKLREKRLHVFRSKSGFTLIEVVVSFALFAIVCSAIIGGFVVSSKVLGDTSKYDKAGDEIVSYIRDVTSGGDNITTQVVNGESATFVLGGATVTIEGKIVVLVYSDGIVVEYRIFESGGK